MKTNELREAYLSFFESKGCVRKPSDLLVPAGDKSVLFTPAGMNQFKEQFLGIGKLEFTRATTCQKCIRTGDIENVGVTARHLTFFEMLGNFSFGDYFKREAIHWGWEFCTKVLRLDPQTLSVTVYQDDDEAHSIWRNEIHLPDSKITRLGEDDNFWPASSPTQGPDGVCGPCSEIFADIGSENIEIWNLVFTQFNRMGLPPNNLQPLPKKNIDTGMGLERTAAVLQGVKTVFDIDSFRPIVDVVAELVGKNYDPAADLPVAQRIRRIAEHARTVFFCMSENVQPGAEKQGYVVRRLLRRALVDAWRLGYRQPLLHRITPTIIECMRSPYPELEVNGRSVAEQIKAEEENFLARIEGGLAYLDDVFKKTGRGGSMSGREAFSLHATHGFPIDLTVELAAGRGVEVDRGEFEREMALHKNTSGKGAFSTEVFSMGAVQKLKAADVPPTDFLGYEELSSPATVVGLIVGADLVGKATGDAILVLDRTPFYGEAGGQVGDRGSIENDAFRFEVSDTQKAGGYIQHVGKVVRGAAQQGAKVDARVDAQLRAGIERAHSATHILHAGLHKILGPQATQKGSKVERDELRFDFHHSKPMTPTELAAVESFAGEQIMSAQSVTAKILPIQEARQLGAMALFGEKYGDHVRVVSMGDFSKELCGGCHLSNTGKVGPIKIVREEAVSSGVRRIVAVVGLEAIRRQSEQEALLRDSAALLKAPLADLPRRIELLQKELRDMHKSAAQRKSAATGDVLELLLENGVRTPSALIVVGAVDGSSADDLRQLCDRIRVKEPSSAILLATSEEEKVILIANVNGSLQGRLKAGDWIRDTSAVVEGKGGGRPDLAQGGGKNPAKIPQALELARSMAIERLQ